MNRFAKIMQVLGWLGVAVLTIVWVQGFFVRDNAPELARHSAVAILAASLCVLPRFWTVAYLSLAARGRATRRRRGPGAPTEVASPERLDRSTRIRRWAIVSSAVALIALSGSFALAGAIVLRRASPVAHALAGLAAIALQVVALAFERRALRADADEMAAMPAAPAIPAPGEGARSAS
ncbi:MAG: hypothetical protein ABI689_16810 [Thermoanaerobaculia bacterium]